MTTPALFPIIRRRRVPLTNNENPAVVEVKQTVTIEPPEVPAVSPDLNLVGQVQAELPQAEVKPDATPIFTSPPDSVPSGTGHRKKGRQ